MDTSDSEYFESADEDIQSDEDSKTIKNPKNDNHIDQNVKTASTTSLIDEVKSGNTNQMKEDDDHEHSQTQNENKLQTSSELISKVENIEIESQSSSSRQCETQIVHSSKHEKSEIVCQDDKFVKSNDVKKSKIKSKLGSKAPKELVQFETSPEKVSKIVAKQEIVDEMKETCSVTENVKTAPEEENLWENDELDWGAEADVESKTTIQQKSPVGNTNKRVNQEEWSNESDGWSAWSNWGASVFSTATQGVSTITSQITNVIETGLGAVDPEELARIQREERKNSKSELLEENKVKAENDFHPESSYGGFGLGNLVKLVENTGTKVINGGLDTLETIGKKTMEVLQEGDPGLKKKKAFLKIDQDKPVLSQILREAKERAENESRTSEVGSIKKWKNYETLFDDHHGLVHLEALELLSKQCEIKLKSFQSSMSGEEYTDFSETMDQIKELCELPDEDDEEQISIDEIKEKLEKAVAEINIPINYEKLVTNWDETEVWLSTLNLEICDEKEVHQQAIETLAEMTSRAMEQFHKSGELLLVKERRSTADEADSLVQITATLISLIGIVAAKFSEKLNGKIPNNKEVSGLITNVFFEAANSSSYIQDALQLLIPVLQVGAI